MKEGFKYQPSGEGGKKEEKTDENSGHYVIASSRAPERRPLERRTLAPKDNSKQSVFRSRKLGYFQRWLEILVKKQQNINCVKQLGYSMSRH